MENTDKSANEADSIAEIYPELSAAEREEAEYHLTRYLDLIERIHDRLNE